MSTKLLAIFIFGAVCQITWASHVVTIRRYCQSGADCPRWDECCLYSKWDGQARCTRMPGVGQRCYTNQPYIYDKPAEMITKFNICPCAPGEFCTPYGDGSAHPQYGPIGICSFGKK